MVCKNVSDTLFEFYLIFNNIKSSNIDGEVG